MNELIAFCENQNCKSIFSVTNFIGGNGNISIQLQNTRFGPCPNCGSYGLIPDGLYKYFDKSISFVRGPKESLDKLLSVKKLILEYRDQQKTKDEILHKVKEMSPEYGQAIQNAPDIDYHKWIGTILAILTAAILVQQTYFKGNDDEIKDKIIEQLLIQNKNLTEKIQPNNSLNKNKIGRNEK